MYDNPTSQSFDVAVENKYVVESKDIQDVSPIKPKKAVPFYGELRFWIIMMTILQPFFSTGLIYGWAGMLLILKGENTYAWLCKPDDNTFKITESGSIECNDLDVYLNYISATVIVVQMLGAFVGGIFNDIFGPKFLVIIQLMITLGTMFMAIADPKEGDALDLFLFGLALQNVFSSTLSPSLFHYAHLYPQLYYIISSTLATSVAVSSVIYPTLHGIWKGTDLNRSQILWIYTAVVGFFISFSAIQPFRKITSGCTISFNWRILSLVVHPPTNLEIKTVMTNQGEKSASVVADKSNDKKASLNKRMGPPPPSLVNARETQNKKNYFKVIFRDYGCAFRSKYFLSYLVYEAFWANVFLFYLTSQNPQLTAISGDRDWANYMTEFFSWVTPFGFIGALCAGVVLDRWGYKYAILFQGLLGMVHVIASLTSVPNLQYITFAFYTFSQEAHFACIFTFAAQFFRVTTTVTFTGSILAFNGLWAYAINPIVDAILDAEMGFIIPKIVLVVAGVVSLSCPIFLSWTHEDVTRSLNLKVYK